MSPRVEFQWYLTRKGWRLPHWQVTYREIEHQDCRMKLTQCSTLAVTIAMHVLFHFASGWFAHYIPLFFLRKNWLICIQRLFSSWMCPKSSLKTSQKHRPTLLPEPKHQQKTTGENTYWTKQIQHVQSNPLGLQIPRCVFYVYEPWGGGQHQKAGPVHDPLLFRALFHPPAGEVVGTCLANGHMFIVAAGFAGPTVHQCYSEICDMDWCGRIVRYVIWWSQRSSSQTKAETSKWAPDLKSISRKMSYASSIFPGWIIMIH